MKPTRGGHNGGTGSAGSSASSSKVKRRPASAVGPVRQLQFTVGPVADDDLDSPMFSQQPARQPTNNGNGRVTPPLAVSRPQFQQHQPLPPMHVAPVYAPVPAPVPMPAAPSVSAPAPQATGGSGAKPMDVDEFDDDDDFLAGPESLMMIEEAEQRYQATQGVAGGGLGNGLDHGMPLVDGDALQQEFDALPDIVLDDTMISDVLTDTQQRGAGGNAAGAGPSAASRSVPAQEVQALRQQLAEAQKRYRDLENTMTSKDGEITTLRRRENQMTGEFNKLKEQLAAAEAAIVTARQEEHAKLQREIEMLRKDVAFMEQEQQKVRRGMPPVASQSAPVGEVSASQVWRATPSKARTGPSSAFAKPAPVSVAGRPPPSPAPPPFRKSMGPSTFDDMAFGPTQVPQQQQQQQFQFPQPVAKPGGTAAVVDGRADRPAQAVQGVVPKFSAVKLRMARMESEARAKEDRRNLFVRELFSDPIFNPTTANKNSTKSSSSLLLPTSFALRPHPTAKVSRDSIARFDAARISLAGILTASVGQKDIPLSSILSPLESFFSSAMEHGDVQLVLFCVRLVKMLVNADEGCRAAILGCNLNSFASQTYNNKNKSGPQPMSVDSDDESDDEAVAASKANTLEQLCRLLRHAAHIVSPNQPGVFSWLAESETHQVATDVLSVLSSITWNRDPKSLNKFAVVFESRWHRYLCLKTQPLKIVSDFVHFCSGLLKSPKVFALLVASSNNSYQNTTTDEDESRYQVLDLSFLDQLASFFIEDFPAKPTAHYRRDCLTLRCYLVRLFSSIAVSDFAEGGPDALLKSQRVIFWIVRSLSSEIMDSIDGTSPSRPHTVQLILETVRLINVFTTQKIGAFRRLLGKHLVQAHDLLVLNMGRLANGTLLDILPEVAVIEDMSRNILQIVAEPEEEEEIQQFFGRTKDRQEREAAGEVDGGDMEQGE